MDAWRIRKHTKLNILKIFRNTIDKVHYEVNFFSSRFSATGIIFI